MSMTCDLIYPRRDPDTGVPVNTTRGIIVHLKCDICRAPQDFFMTARADGHYPTEPAKRVTARKHGWRFDRVLSVASGTVRTKTICPRHTPDTPKPGLVLLDIAFDAKKPPPPNTQ